MHMMKGNVKLIIDCKFSKKDGYAEKDFFDVISKSFMIKYIGIYAFRSMETGKS